MKLKSILKTVSFSAFLLSSFSLSAQNDTTNDNFQNKTSNSITKIVTANDVQIGESSYKQSPKAVLTLTEKNQERNTLALNGVGGKYPNMAFYKDNSWRANINYDLANETLKFSVQGQDNYMALHRSNGTLLIGTTDIQSGYKLIVKDGILTEKIRVAAHDTDDWAPWPDYVFEESYEKMSLNELEEFITTEKHLPHVPSAKEVEEKGIDVVEMDAAILKSVEELYLYTIEISNENEELKEENKELLKAIESLSERIEKLEK